MKKVLNKVVCVLLASLMLLSFAACSSDESKLEKYIEKNGAELESSFEAGFGMDCDCDIYADGTTMVLDCKITGFNDIPEETKQQLQDTYDSMGSYFKSTFEPAKEEVPALEGVKINVCEEDGDILATINVELD